MASPARQLPSRAPRKENAPSRNNFRLVVDNTRPRARAAQGVQRDRAIATLFKYLSVAIVLSVVLGLGAVFISADATCCSQQSALIKTEIARQTARAQALELQRAQLRSSSRVEKIAREELNMTAPTGKALTLEIGEDKPVAQKTAAAQPQKKSSTLKRVARLTAGGASALLVGDINVAAAR